MSFDQNNPHDNGFVIDGQAVARAVEDRWETANTSKDGVISEFECDRSKSSSTLRMLEGAKYIAQQAGVDETSQEVARSVHIGALLGVYVAELCASQQKLSSEEMYRRWTEAGGWMAQAKQYTNTSVTKYGTEAFRRLPEPIAGIAVRFAADSQLAKSVDDAAAGYGLTLEPLYEHLNDMRLSDEIDADLHALLGN